MDSALTWPSHFSKASSVARNFSSDGVNVGDHEQDDADRGRVAEVRLLDALAIEQQHDRRERVVGDATGTAHDERLVEQLQRADDRHGGHEEVGRGQERQRDPSEDLPPARAVDRGRLVDVAC